MNISKTTFLVLRLMRIRFRGKSLFNMVAGIYITCVRRDFHKAAAITSLILFVFGIRYWLMVLIIGKERRDIRPQGAKACGSGF